MNNIISAKIFRQDTLDTFKHRLVTILKSFTDLETILTDKSDKRVDSLESLSSEEIYELAYERGPSKFKSEYSVKGHLGLESLQ